MEFDPSIFTQMGLIQKISTGNWVFDVVLCSLMPVLFKQLWPAVKAFIVAWMTTKESQEKEFTRTIEYVEKRDYWSSDRKSLNHVLQKAILLYIGSQPDVVARFDQADYSLERVKNHKKITTLSGKLVAAGSGDGDDDDDDNYDWEERELRKYMVNVVPPREAWVVVTDDGVRFMRSVNGSSGGEGGDNNNGGDGKKIAFTLQATGPDARQRVDAFVDAAFAAYKNKMRSDNDMSRYLYTPLGRAMVTSSNDDDDNGIQYKQYKLSEDKTFASFFHAEKALLLKLVNNFMHKEGKYAVPGYPHKLGLLLYGPPGTGKTSLIKALAQHTKRHIVNIPLAKVRTNQELMDIIFDQHFNVVRNDMPKNLSFSRTIFVMEDVDAAADVVLARSEQQCARPMPIVLPRPPPVNDSDSEDDGGNGKKKKRSKKKTKDAGEGETTAAAGGKDPTVGWFEHPDKLNLAGLLNVLDGVVDCPGRIVVMTSNHPERLDPALIRPGRIDKKLFLGHLDATCAAQMVSHYYGADALPAPLAARLASNWADGVVTPAELEMLCAQHDEVAELLDALRARNAAAPGPASEGPPAASADDTAVATDPARALLTPPPQGSKIPDPSVARDLPPADPAHAEHPASDDPAPDDAERKSSPTVAVDATFGADAEGETPATLAGAESGSSPVTADAGGDASPFAAEAEGDSSPFAAEAEGDSSPFAAEAEGDSSPFAAEAEGDSSPFAAEAEGDSSPFASVDFPADGAEGRGKGGKEDDALVSEVMRVNSAVAAALAASEDIETACKVLSGAK